MSGPKYESRKYSTQKWREVGDGRMRYEKAHAWHFTFDNGDKEAKAAYAKNYEAIDWSDDGSKKGDG